MNYYTFHIADFISHTAHLTLVEEAIYRRLLDHYYDTEEPIPLITGLVLRRLRLTEYEQIANQILGEFFIKTEKGYRNLRADDEIDAYHKKAEQARINGRNGGRPLKGKKHKPPTEQKTFLIQGWPITGLVFKNNQRKTGLVIYRNPEITGLQPDRNLTKNQEPITNNQKPKTNNQKKTKTPKPPCETVLPNGSGLSVNPANDLNADAKAVFEHWQKVFNKNANAKFTPERKRKVLQRLSEYGLQTVLDAIDGCAVSDFHQGENDNGAVYDDLELICRNGGKVEAFAKIKHNKKNKPQKNTANEYVNSVANGKAFTIEGEFERER